MELYSPLLLYIRNSYIQRLSQGIGEDLALCRLPTLEGRPTSRSVLLLSIPMLRVLEPTCVVAVVVRIAKHCISFVHGTTRVVAQFSTRV